MGLSRRSITVDIVFEFADFLDDGFVVFAVEGRDCSEQDVEDNSC
jgi:hypothetical protein